MKTKRLWAVPFFFGWSMAFSQIDGDHTITNGAGVTFLAPDTLVGIGIAPVRFNVGTLGTGLSLLQVSGQQLGSGEVFRTNSEWFTLGGTTYGTDSHWRMYRATNAAPNNFGMEMGEIYCRNNVPGDLNTNLGFNIQGKRQNGGVWLRNHRGRPNYDSFSQLLDNDEPRGNGLRLIDDSTRAGGGLSLNAYTGISRIGYVAIGHALNMDEPATSGEMIMPWTRLHLVDGFGWPGETPYPLDIPEWKPYRPFCRNGVSFSGNSTYAYPGHKYALRDYPYRRSGVSRVPIELASVSGASAKRAVHVSLNANRTAKLQRRCPVAEEDRALAALGNTLASLGEAELIR